VSSGSLLFLPQMPLSKTDYKRRLDAALALNDMTLDEVDVILASDEWRMGQEAASRPGRPSDKREPGRGLSGALGQILGVGEAWFEAEDWRPILSEGAAAAEGRSEEIGELKAQRSVLLSTISLVRSELEELRKHPRPQ